MKKAAAAWLVAGSMCAGAHAQGTVTLYGIVDAGLGYTSDQRVAQTKGALGSPVGYRNESSYGFASGTWSGSRWGAEGQGGAGRRSCSRVPARERL
ncbi:gram-negative porin family protein [Burkholderia pseudomallei]|nr:porin, Gram-negative type [Burkholderia pseudomallei 668]AJX89710.1 gram-negative porin family protein [Burkholderia pseudomallei]